MKPGSIFSILFLCAIFLFAPANGQNPVRGMSHIEKKAIRRTLTVPDFFYDWRHLGAVRIDSVMLNKSEKIATFYFNQVLTYIPIRKKLTDSLRVFLHKQLGRSFRDYNLQLYTRGQPLEVYIPNYFRDTTSKFDLGRVAKPYPGIPLLINLDKPVFSGGLTGNHIALWPSHGFYFNQEMDRWQWQRARLYGTVEDIFPWSFTNSYLVPMLENSGATVLLPRERDTQVHEVIVDNDRSSGNSELVIIDGSNKWDRAIPGFIPADTLFPGQNPFEMGTSLSIATIPADTARLIYIPEIQATGDYAVYVSWAKTDKCISRVRYDVNYTGGLARFSINQCMGAGTWVYLGTFNFQQGKRREQGSVVVYGGGAEGVITSDAVRFGGGMGNVARNYKLSGKPRWMEGSRYYLQYEGMPDTLVYNLNAGKNDYNDDYMSRGEWVNYLIGPAKPQYNGNYEKGLNIPVDLALALHTDAGVTWNDSIIGTLGVYSTVRNNGFFPNGQSKLASRDLSDLIQTQVVDDLRQLVNPEWTRRGLWDREYSEAWRPMVPVMLLELLSHQNLADMKYGLDPRFKFTVSRAVYKGILRYLAVQYGRKAVVQPLPPDHMAIEVQEDGKIKISWRPVNDPLENTAMPDGYKVYMKVEDNGFAPGIYTRDTLMVIGLPERGQLYSFRVTALNEGGESLPGETLSAALFQDNDKPVLVVNAFDRICGPAIFDKGDMAGIAWWEDEGVANGKDFSHSGNQYDFDRNSDWLHDDSQGWGASDADMETIQVAGNTFSFPLLHGKALRDAGYSFISVSDEVFESPGYNANRYKAVDIIFGEERGTDSFNRHSGKDFRVFTPAIIESISRYTRSGGNLFISGAYIGTDMVENKDSLAVRFASDILHFAWRTNHATKIGSVYATDRAVKLFPGQIQFNTGVNPDIYKVESPDAIEPSGNGAFRIYRYKSGDCSAGIAYKGSYRTVALGFPFETLLTDEQRIELMKRVMEFLNTSPPAPSPRRGAGVRFRNE
jgi:hypothetical protein